MTIKSKVIDIETRQPIPYASVVLTLKGEPTSIGTSADSQGNFTISSNLLDLPGYELQISSVGYEPDIYSPYQVGQTVSLIKQDASMGAVIVSAVKKNPGKIIAYLVLVVLIVLLFKYANNA